MNHLRRLFIDTLQRTPYPPRMRWRALQVWRSEMVINQKNITFGKMVVGAWATKCVTVTNRSAVPLVYSLHKSASINAGFLRVRKVRKRQRARERETEREEREKERERERRTEGSSGQAPSVCEGKTKM